MPSRYEFLDFSRVKRIPVRERAHKVRVEDFASCYDPATGFQSFLDSLPRMLAGNDLRRLISSVVRACEGKKQVVFMLGAHVVKTGLTPVLTDLMERGVITALAVNGGCAIHDFEIALWGETSEDVTKGLKDGRFGMVEETGREMNEAISRAAHEGTGLGEALGKRILEVEAKHRDFSLLARGYELSIPVTVHLTLGADTIHSHPDAQGGAYGEASFRDFQIFCSVVSKLEGGVLLNVGSAVVLPEVFLKALSVARNLGFGVKTFTSANLDMSYQYRPEENVVRRPLGEDSEGVTVIGRHELILPLLAAGLRLSLSGNAGR